MNFKNEFYLLYTVNPVFDTIRQNIEQCICRGFTYFDAHLIYAFKSVRNGHASFNIKRIAARDSGYYTK